MLNHHFYRIKAQTQGKANGGELESCIAGTRCVLSTEKKKNPWRPFNLLWPPYNNHSKKQHKRHTCFYKLSLKLIITFVLHAFLCCYLWSILTLIIGIWVLQCIVNPRFQLKKTYICRKWLFEYPSAMHLRFEWLSRDIDNIAF